MKIVLPYWKSFNVLANLSNTSALINRFPNTVFAGFIRWKNWTPFTSRSVSCIRIALSVKLFVVVAHFRKLLLFGMWRPISTIFLVDSLAKVKLWCRWWWSVTWSSGSGFFRDWDYDAMDRIIWNNLSLFCLKRPL